MPKPTQRPVGRSDDDDDDASCLAEFTQCLGPSDDHTNDCCEGLFCDGKCHLFIWQPSNNSLPNSPITDPWKIFDS